jgi:hypothetical protein
MDAPRGFRVHARQVHFGAGPFTPFGAGTCLHFANTTTSRSLSRYVRPTIPFVIVAPDPLEGGSTIGPLCLGFEVETRLLKLLRECYGPYRGGGRWIYAIYGSIESGLAAEESFNFLLQHFGWQNRDIPPRMVVGIRVSLQSVVDLTNPASVLHQLNLEELLSEDWRKMNGE